MDALAYEAEEGRSKPAKVIGEEQASLDPIVSEWGNPAGFNPVIPCRTHKHEEGKRGN